MTSTFIAPIDLKSLIQENGELVIIVDLRYYLADPGLAFKEYEREHIPGAIFANLDKDLSSPIVPTSGRHPLPVLSDFKNWLNENGIAKSNKIIIYDSNGGGIAARLWFMLVQLGFESVFVLEGGILNWKGLNFPLDSGINKRERLTYLDQDLPEQWEDGVYKLYTKSEIKEFIETDSTLIDSRSPERYSGQEEPIDPVAGHIPSAINLFWGSSLNSDLTLKSHNELKSNFENMIDEDKVCVFYCGSGVTAAFNVLMMKHLGLPDPGIYIGSWSEWIRD